jgi:hypothetical protein
LTLPLNPDGRWRDGFLQYWTGFGAALGAEVPGMAAADQTVPVRQRTIRVRPEIVVTVIPRDLNIVARHEVLTDAQRLDLVIATNVLVYYDPLDQQLALANIAQMLRPGAYLLANTAIVPVMATGITRVGGVDVTHSDRPNSRDRVWVYRRD